MLHVQHLREDGMYIATNRIRVQENFGEKLESRFKERRGIEKQPGFLNFELWKLDDPEERGCEEYLVVTRWESESDFRAWAKSDMFNKAHSGPRQEYILEHPTFKGYEGRQSFRLLHPLDETVGSDIQKEVG